MTELSIIVVSRNNENFIEQGLRSCFFENATDYEIILVDNGSTDDTLRIAERVKEKCSAPLKIIANGTNLGPGEARNQGLDAAKGEYLLYLDGDDWFSDDAYRRLMGIARARDIDVIEFNHARAWNTGRFTKNTQSKLLKEADASSPSVRAPIMANFGVVWNKLYRVAYLRSLGVRFAHGIYEDVSFNFAVKLNAESYYVIPDILVNYRQRAGSITKTREDRHIDVITEYSAVVEMLKANPQWNHSYGKTIYKYGRSQMLNIIRVGDRLTPQAEKRYMSEAHALLKKWRRDVGVDSFDLRFQALRTGSAKLYHVVDTSIDLARAASPYLRRLVPKRQWYTALRQKADEAAYKHLFLRRPIDEKKVLFESYWGKKADCNPLAIAQKLREHGGYRIIFSLNKDAPVPDDFPFETVVRGSRAFYAQVATARYVISNTNLLDPVKKRKGTTHVQTWHGTPIKVMGIDIRPYVPKEMDWTNFIDRSSRWDYVISSNPHSSYVWRRSCPINFKVLETGYPRNDIFFTSTQSDIDRIRKSLGVPEGKKVALYAPTVRDELRGKKLPDAADIFDPARVAAALGEEWVLLVRSHYFLKGAASVPENVIDASSYQISNEVCLITDLMITDYSSMMFDFACLKRPIVIYGYDAEDYASNRGVYIDICADTHSPGAVAIDQNELLRILSTGEFLSDGNRQRLEAFHNEYCQFDDGRASERVIEKVFGIRIK